MLLKSVMQKSAAACMFLAAIALSMACAESAWAVDANTAGLQVVDGDNAALPAAHVLGGDAKTIEQCGEAEAVLTEKLQPAGKSETTSVELPDAVEGASERLLVESPIDDGSPSNDSNDLVCADIADNQAQRSHEAASDALGTEGEDNASTAADGAEEGPIVDGLYTIQSLVGAPFVLDVAGGSKDSGANVQIYESNNTDAQKWKFSFLNGYYTIISAASGKALDVSGANRADGANVQQYQPNGTDAQLWKLVAHGNDVYTIVSKLDSSFALDVSGASASNGANVQIYRDNRTNAQQWYIGPLGSLVGERLVEDGVYTVASALKKDLVLDISGGSYGNEANIQLYGSNDTNAQRWAFTWDETSKSYTVRNAANAKSLDVSGGSIASSVNVQQYEFNGTDAQRWVIQKAGNGYVLRNAISGMALDVLGGSKSAGANVQVYRPNGTVAQSWVLKKTDGSIAEGIYNIYTMLAPSSQALEVVGGSRDAGVRLQTNAANVSFEQKFRLFHVSDDIYTMQSVNSGLFLSASDGVVVQADQSSGLDQHWAISFDANGLRIVSAIEGASSIEVSGGKAKSGSKLVLVASAKTDKQLYRFQIVNLISDGHYLVRNASSDLVLDISGGSYSQQANVQQYSANGSGAQTFVISAVGDSYQIMNARSFKVLDVANGSKSAGANVQQYGWNGTEAQLWDATLGDDGCITFTNRGSKLVLEVASASKADGANVQQNKASADNAGQLWRLEAVKAYTLSGDGTLDRYVADILGNHPDLYSAYCYVADFSYREGNRFWDGDKYLPNSTTISYAKEMVEHGSGNCYRFSSLFCWLARGLGYEANVASGWVVGYSNPKAPHGWVEVYQNGTYICDPDMYNANRGVDWYMRTYENAPTGYNFW